MRRAFSYSAETSSGRGTDTGKLHGRESPLQAAANGGGGNLDHALLKTFISVLVLDCSSSPTVESTL
jgi:hypothetical protein